MTVSRKALTLIQGDHITSPCHGAPIWASLGDGVMVGSCSKCGEYVCRANPRTGKAEWLNGNSPWDGRDAREPAL